MARTPTVKKSYRLFVEKLTPKQKKNVKKWVEWLEAKKFPQSHGEFVNGYGGHCCLAVGAKVAGWESAGPRASMMRTIDKKTSQEGAFMNRDAMGLVTYMGDYDGDHDLVYLNDDLKLTHPQIGRFIRKCYKAQFGEDL